MAGEFPNEHGRDILRGLRFDSGYEDEFTHIPPTARGLSSALTAHGIEHVFEEYNGDHRNRLWGRRGRLATEVVPYFWLLLDSQSQRYSNSRPGPPLTANPWHYFGGGVKFSIGTDSYRMSFVRPNDASDASVHLLARTTFGRPAPFLKVLDIGEGRRAGRAWKALLASRAS